MDLVRLARYPFLPEAARYIEDDGPGLDELLTERVYAGARAAGRARVMLALEEAALPAPRLADASPQRELLEELLSYVYARILISALDDAYVTRRYALAEAVRARDLLLAEEDGEALERCARAVGLDFTLDGDEYATHFTEFLRYAVFIKDLPWKLVRQPLAHGVVRMDPQRASRLVQEALRRRTEEELPRKLPDEVKKLVDQDLGPIRAAAAARKEAYQAEGFGMVDLSLIPPCMHNILGQLQRGENAAHNARFAIVTFLNKIGMTSEDIMQLFSQAPDFREDLTRYQVEHITGVTSGTTYNVPGCDNLQTFNLCYADDLCRTKFKDGRPRVRYPGDYYRYLAEAKPHVDAIAETVPLANADVLVRAAAMNYALLKKLENIVGRGFVSRLDPARVVEVARKRKVPIAIDGDGADARLVVPQDDPWAITLFLESEWLRDALAPPKPAPAAPQPAGDAS